MLSIRKTTLGPISTWAECQDRDEKYVNHNSLTELAPEKVKIPHRLTQSTRGGCVSIIIIIFLGITTEEDSFNKYLLSNKHVLYSLAT